MLENVTKKKGIGATLSKCAGPVEFLNVCFENLRALPACKPSGFLIDLN
jgi:hypothetical protein